MKLQEIYDRFQNSIEEVMDSAFNSILEELNQDEDFDSLADDEKYELVYDLMEKYTKGE
jgi:hypothetical protein